MYRIRPARSAQEDLEAIRLFGHGLYGFPLEKLAEFKTRDELAALGLRMAQRAGHTAVVVDGHNKITGASRITPSPQGIRDPETGEIEHWETVAIHPRHQGRGLSLPLRKFALDTSDAVVIKSRIKEDNPKSWRVAEQLGFEHCDRDGNERIYIMRRPQHKKTAAWTDPLVAGGIGTAVGAGLGMMPNDDGDDIATRTGDGAITGGLTGVGAGLGHLIGSQFTATGPGSMSMGSLAGLGGGIGGYLLGEELKRRRRLERGRPRRTLPFVLPAEAP